MANRYQMMLALCAVLIGLFALASAINDDQKCRNLALKQNINLGPNVDKFRMYGVPRAPATCDDLCMEHGKDVALTYVGKQACCCAKTQATW